ncbi:MAG: hypothetical protein AAGM84_14165 [Pseudomonadota bacterium]
MDDHRSSAPDYTTACIVMFGVNLTWIFFAIWAFWGLLAVALIGWGLNRWMAWLERRRG